MRGGDTQQDQGGTLRLASTLFPILQCVDADPQECRKLRLLSLNCARSAATSEATGPSTCRARVTRPGVRVPAWIAFISLTLATSSANKSFRIVVVLPASRSNSCRMARANALIPPWWRLRTRRILTIPTVPRTVSSG